MNKKTIVSGCVCSVGSVAIVALLVFVVSFHPTPPIRKKAENDIRYVDERFTLEYAFKNDLVIRWDDPAWWERQRQKNKFQREKEMLEKQMEERRIQNEKETSEKVRHILGFILVTILGVVIIFGLMILTRAACFSIEPQHCRNQTNNTTTPISQSLLNGHPGDSSTYIRNELTYPGRTQFPSLASMPSSLSISSDTLIDNAPIYTEALNRPRLLSQNTPPPSYSSLSAFSKLI